MLDAIHHPLRPAQAALVALALVAAVMVYCLIYTALAGRSESAFEAAAWALVNVLPWLAAFEFAKRARSLGGKACVLAAALILSLALGFVLLPRLGDLPFEVVRRLPGLLLTASLMALAIRRERRASAAEPLALPLAPAQLDWVAAAGNYVELHAAGRTLLHRAPLSRVEAQLSRHGFVRVHRSILVRRDRIARVRPLDVILHDGTSLRTGSRYRAALRR
jgi:DNA-binding LytR/AlgR family response regulator